MFGGRRLSTLGLLGLSLVALVIAHNLEFILAYGAGAGAMLARTGHGPEWTTAVGIVLGGAIALALIGALRLARLWQVARRLEPVREQRTIAWGDLLRELGARWASVSVVTAAFFVTQENAERASAGTTLPGIGVLWNGDYPPAAIVIAIVCLAVSAVALLFRRGTEHFAARIAAAARTYQAHSPGRPWAAPVRDRRPSWVVGSGLAGRAPPDGAIT